MARKHSLTELTAVNSQINQEQDSKTTSSSETSGTQGARRAIGAVSRSFEKIKSQGIIELDPDMIDAPLIKDRLEIQGEALDGLINQFRTSGQQVPILVRPHPDIQERYQIVYGWRRTAAAKALGIKVKGTVKRLTDEELVVAQGQENNEREDLTFIEKALYASNLEEAGFSRAVIMAALSIDKTTCSRLISTTTKIPRELIEAIGAAPKTGRDRWVELTAMLDSPEFTTQMLELTESAAFINKSSDERFKLVFKAFAQKGKKKGSSGETWKSQDGKKIARISQTDKAVTLVLNQKQAPEFGSFIVKSLPELYAAYRRRMEE